jgi:hypothetical protein
MPIHGKNTRVLIDKYDFSSILNESSVTESVDTLETTTYNSQGNAKTYVNGLQDGTASFAGFYDTGVNGGDTVIDGFQSSTNPQPITIGFEGLSLGRQCQLWNSQQTSYERSSPVGDMVTVSVESQATGGIGAGPCLLPLAAYTAVANQASVDNGAATSSGLVAHLHAITVSGTTPSFIVKVQHSTDNTTFTDLATFTNVTAAAAQRLATTGTVNRYLRAAITGASGTTPSATMAMAIARQ